MFALRIGLVQVFICLVTSSMFSQTSVVQVVENSPQNWELHIDGEPFYIKSAGWSLYLITSFLKRSSCELTLATLL